MNIPISWFEQNLIDGTKTPSGVKNRNNASYQYFERALFQRALSVIDIDGLPEELPPGAEDFLMYCLFKYGFVPFFRLEKYGRVFQPAALSGVSLYYQPTKALVTNPNLSTSLELEIGKDTELLKLTPDYQGIWDIITFYADKLALLDSALNQTLVNSRFAYLVRGKNKAAATALKKVFDQINSGNPVVVMDNVVTDGVNNESPFELIDRKDVKAGYLTTDLLRDYRTLLDNFDTEIGIPTLPIEKKERMITSEAEGRTIDATSRSRIWVDTLNRSAEYVNAMFDLNITAKLNFDDLKMGGGEDGEIDDLGNANKPT